MTILIYPYSTNKGRWILLGKRRAEPKSLARTRNIAWALLFIIIVAVFYFVFAAPSGYRNQCENLPASFTIIEGGKPVEVPIGLADVEVSTTGLTLYPFTVDGYGHKTYLTPQVTHGNVLLNPLDTIQALQNTYAYSTAHFPTTQFYRGAITTDTGTIRDTLYFIERANINWVSCSVKT